MRKYAAPIARIIAAVREKERKDLFGEFVTLCALAFGIYQLLQAIVVQSTMTSLIAHVLGTIVVTCLASISGLASSPRFISFRLIFRIFVLVSAVASLVYIFVHAERIDVESPWISNLDIVVAFVLFFAASAATWLAWGPVLSIIGIVGIVYFLFGHYLPGILGFPWESLGYAMSYLGMSLKTGMFWLMPLSMTTFFPLMVFGIVLQSTGAIEAFTELIRAASKISRIAPVYVCNLESGLVGMVTGSSSANVVLTGSGTIPAMKRIGIKPTAAAGFEACASTGSQLVPPIMGLAAFIMAQLLAIPYVEVMIAAIIPAFLYYGALIISSYFTAHNALGRVSKSTIEAEAVDWKKIYRLFPTFAISLGGLIWFLYKGYSPLYAATMAIGAAIFLSQTQGKFRPSLGKIVEGFGRGAILGSQIAVIIMSIGFLGQSLITTGLGLRFSQVFKILIGGSFTLGLVVLMIVSLILGMGAPTVVAYVLVSIAVVPALQDLGISIIAGHFFAFYFACFSHITPPVAIAIVAASKLAGTDFMETAWHAMKLAWPLLFIPFFFVFHPEILTLSDLSLATFLEILGYFFIALNGAACIWDGLPFFRIGIVSRGFLAIVVVAWVFYLFGGGNTYIFIGLLSCIAGWGAAFLRIFMPKRVMDSGE